MFIHFNIDHHWPGLPAKLKGSASQDERLASLSIKY